MSNDDFDGPDFGDDMPSWGQLQQENANNAFRVQAVQAASGGQVDVFEPSWYWRPELSSVDLERSQGIPDTGSITTIGWEPTVRVSVDGSQHVHATIHERSHDARDASLSEVAGALGLDQATARTTVLLAAHQLQRGQAAYDAPGEVAAAVAAFDRQHADAAGAETLRWEPDAGQGTTERMPDRVAEMSEARQITHQQSQRPERQQPPAASPPGQRPPGF